LSTAADVGAMRLDRVAPTTVHTCGGIEGAKKALQIPPF
jgi:hypothetical protein